ncbi:MAG: OmpA family protein [Bacteroidetes bacterium]|nr:OmpA family protein [Bacteroidota bacterium]
MKAMMISLFLVILAFHSAVAQIDEPLTLQCTHPQTAAAEVRAVFDENPMRLTVTPVNELGEHIPELTTADFRINKGKKEAELLSVTERTALENTVMRVVFMVDNSQSMSPYLRQLRNTLEKTITSLSPAVRVSIIFFRDGSTGMAPFEYNGETLPLIRLPYTYDKARAADYTSKMLVERNLSRNTYLYDGVYATSQQIAADTGSVDRSFAIVFSDGEDLGSNVQAEGALRAEKYGTVFFTIDYLTKANDFLIRLADQTGGEHFRATNTEELESIFEAISEKIVAKGYDVTYRFKSPPSVALTASTHSLLMEEEIVRETFPLLNYVFFGEASAVIPDRYARIAPMNIADFDESAIEGDALDFYYNALNIIGSRLRTQPDMSVTIHGYVSNTGSERRNNRLASDRAETVRDYLRTVWGIEEARLGIDTGTLPPLPSSSKDTLGQAENRRVEITSEHPDLLRPVTFVRRIAGITPDRIRFIPTIEAEEGLASWVLTIEQQGRVFDRREGARAESSLTWNWKNLAGELPAASGDMVCRMLVHDQAGDTDLSNPITIGVREVKSERRQSVSVTEGGITIEKISLILFPFDVAKPGERNEQIMNEHVYPRITPGSRISVNGYTDIIGSEEYNLKLSQQRAEAVREIILERLGEEASERVTAIGHGKMTPIFSNDIPEGRFYNRTVNLIIERWAE